MEGKIGEGIGVMEEIVDGMERERIRQSMEGGRVEFKFTLQVH